MAGPGSSAEPARLPLVGVVAAQFLWASGNVLAAWIDFPAPQLAFWRFGTGAAIYWLVLTLTGRRVVSARSLRLSAWGGTAWGLNLGLLYLALRETTVANAIVISALQPVLVALVAHRLFGERLDRRAGGLVLVAFAGVTVVVFGASGVTEWSLAGDLIALAATLAWSWYFIATKQARRHLGIWEYQTSALCVATAVVLPYALVLEGGIGRPDPATLGWILVLIALPGTGHLIMNWAHAHVAITTSTTMTLLLPPLSTIGAAIALDQPVVALQVLGMGVVLVALGAFIRLRTSPVVRSRA